MNQERHICPDREGLSPLFLPKLPYYDVWRADRWSKNVLLVKIRHFFDLLIYRLRHKGQTITLGKHNDEWLWPWGPPRICSYCGGIHPEDAIRLVEQGWEVESTGKSYKRYLEPKGYHKHVLDVSANLATFGKERHKIPEFWSPVPPVKMYVSHFSRDQIERFNKALVSNT